MIEPQLIQVSPWDTLAFGRPVYELLNCSEVTLKNAISTPGHYTVKVNPLLDKRLLHEYGFYYCDTLIEPFCTVDRLQLHQHPSASFSKEFDRNELIAISQDAFIYGRFHRDFNLPTTSANSRYNKWLIQLIDEQNVFSLYWDGELAGFIGYSDNHLVLHALSEGYRSRGLSKYWWSQVSVKLFEMGHKCIESSISVANIPVLNLYVSLGFSFKNPHDVYHRMVL